MRLTDLKELEWIHDCSLLDISYNNFAEAGCSIKITVRCPSDLGNLRWNGKILLLEAVEVAASSYVFWGTAGSETIDSISPGISSAFRESTMKARQMGVRFPSLEFIIRFTTGSALEIICENLQIDT
jgi:hypothetical protein